MASSYTLTTKYKDLAFKKKSSSVLVIENFKEHMILNFFNFLLSLLGEITPVKKSLVQQRVGLLLRFHYQSQ